jgi:glycerate dehydrogenase
MDVFACGRRGSTSLTAESVHWLPLEEVFAACDVVSLHCPLTPETDQMVDSSLLRRMDERALLINTARGGLVNEFDLAEALRSNVIAGAAVDVVSREPIRPDNPLLTAPNCLITPHIAWCSLAARKRIIATAADNISAFLAGRRENDVTVRTATD